MSSEMYVYKILFNYFLFLQNSANYRICVIFFQLVISFAAVSSLNEKVRLKSTNPLLGL